MKLHVLIVLKVQLIDQYGLIDVDIEVDLNALVKHAVVCNSTQRAENFNSSELFLSTNINKSLLLIFFSFYLCKTIRVGRLFFHSYDKQCGYCHACFLSFSNRQCFFEYKLSASRFFHKLYYLPSEKVFFRI
jgi:hypothetical protein